MTSATPATPDPASPADTDHASDGGHAPFPTGAQWTLRRGDDELSVTEVGGGLRRWTRGGVDVLAGYPADSAVIAGRGQQLIPWPNRIADGRYSFDGVDLQLGLTEPKLHNASHGLVRWATWALVDRTDDSLTVGHRLHPQPGWSWTLDLTTVYRLTDAGLEVTTTATNRSATRAPYGYGTHPYLALADTDLAAVTLELPASTYLEVEAERLLPVATHPVDDTAYDFRGGRVLGDTFLDTAFTDLARDGEGRWAVSVSGVPHGRLTLWGDERYGWLQVFTGRATSATEGSNGIAVEPMTCPPGAFVSGVDVVVLGPGESHAGTWGVTVG